MLTFSKKTKALTPTQRATLAAHALKVLEHLRDAEDAAQACVRAADDFGDEQLAWLLGIILRDSITNEARSVRDLADKFRSGKLGS